MNRLIVASPHRHADLARLWHRSVARDVVPALEAAGLRVEVLIFRDAGGEGFQAAHFPGAALEAPGPTARDFIEFYDAALARESDFLFLLDADVFVLDGDWLASKLRTFADPDVAAVSLLARPELPGSVYALLCRTKAYRSLAPPVFGACYEHLERWPDAVHRDPGERAAIRLREASWKLTVTSPAESAEHIADFHGTTNLRVSRSLFADAIGEAQFEALVARHRYFAMGAYDNLLLGSLYQAVFGEPFAPGPHGEPLAGSFTRDRLRSVLARVADSELRARLAAYYRRSDRAIERLAQREHVTLGGASALASSLETAPC